MNVDDFWEDAPPGHGNEAQTSRTAIVKDGG